MEVTLLHHQPLAMPIQEETDPRRREGRPEPRRVVDDGVQVEELDRLIDNFVPARSSSPATPNRRPPVLPRRISCRTDDGDNVSLREMIPFTQ